MRRTVIAGNWKMNMTPAETKAFITELAPMVAGKDKCDIVLCVPYVDIAAAVEAARGTNIHIGAENVHFAASGAYTGEISATVTPLPMPPTRTETASTALTQEPVTI